MAQIKYIIVVHDRTMVHAGGKGRMEEQEYKEDQLPDALEFFDRCVHLYADDLRTGEADIMMVANIDGEL